MSKNKKNNEKKKSDSKKPKGNAEKYSATKSKPKKKSAVKKTVVKKTNKTNKKKVDISPYVSNVKGSVYAISGLPEEFIATLFAWVSRSPKSFKEHLIEALGDHNVNSELESFKELDERAKKFHEKWTVDYGHQSVAEHAVAHVGIEDISRIASEELKLSNTFLSITEYSQRYQKPKRNNWHNPIDKRKKTLHKKVNDFFNDSFDVYEKLVKKLYEEMCQEENIKPNATNKKEEPIRRKLLRLAYEDARYVLPLSMHTQLGITANGRAWRDAISVLDNSNHKESYDLSNDIRSEVSKVLPVLLKYSTASQYQKNVKKRLSVTYPEYNINNKGVKSPQLQSVMTERDAINRIVSLLNQSYTNMPYSAGMLMSKRQLDKKQKEAVIKNLLFEMEHFDQAPEVFKHIKYDALLSVSEANWHQLLRHNRKTNFTYSRPSPHFGITIPPRIKKYGLESMLKDIANKSKELYDILVADGYDKEAEYVVINSHHRHVYMSFDLWEAYHLINLRTDHDSQWDIRNTFEQLYQQLSSVHPLLFSNAKRRLK